MRVAEFDREQVLRSAMYEFMSKGFNKTSMQDLKRATGLHPGSIYCAFENKRGLLLAALAHYACERTEEFNAIFAAQPTVMAGLKSYFCMVVDECAREEIKDCLLQKALSELSQQDDEVEQVIRDTLNIWKLGLLAQLKLAQQRAEIHPDADCEFLAEYLVMGIYGLRSFAHTKPKKELLCKMSDQLLSTIQA
ncbi:TetR/AcrR family transcriptional regulator [Vibrio fluvialis]|uniref:TetR/AcrR family transcriptional regulator n=1 Tax=Vibrio fluvialis TaxID=676 RepID=UPI0028F74A08|nr:TetR/AcrR family transcriptional regulator [Vibrio fluvialis]